MDSLYESMALFNPNLNPFAMRMVQVEYADYEDVAEIEEAKEMGEYTSKL